MKIVNIDPNFSPFGAGIKVESFDFPSGCEPHIRIGEDPDYCEVKVTARIHTMNDLFRLAMAAEILDHKNTVRKTLFLPFVPCARQDRRMTEDEPLSAKIVAEFINMMAFDEVWILDPHSDVIVNLLDNCYVYSNHSFVEAALLDFYTQNPQHVRHVSIVSPDAGSNKKVKDLLVYLNGDSGDYPPYPLIKCDKDRDVTTGHIKGFEICSGTVTDRLCVIVDDICDGGGTFIGLAKKLKKAGASQVILIATHGVFSKQLALDGIDQIYTTNSVRDFNFIPKRFKQFELCQNILI